MLLLALLLTPAAAAPVDLEALQLRGCGRLFLDGGSNRGEAVTAFLKGNMRTCALHSPSRQYSTAWPKLSRAERQALMHPLGEPSTFCIRSFEAAPELLPALQEQEAVHRAKQRDVRFIAGALSNASAASAPRTVVRYARNPWGASAVALRFEDVHVGGQPAALSSRTVFGAAYGIGDVLRAALAANGTAVIALRLDIEGGEWAVLEALVAEPHLLCAISYLFVEFHSTASAEQRARLKAYGHREDAFEWLKARVHAVMEAPTCRLKVYWRSFWASCGDKQRFEWRVSEQATDRKAEANGKVKVRSKRRAGRRMPEARWGTHHRRGGGGGES
jgi:hypothetical protein